MLDLDPAVVTMITGILVCASAVLNLLAFFTAFSGGDEPRRERPEREPLDFPEYPFPPSGEGFVSYWPLPPRIEK